MEFGEFGANRQNEYHKNRLKSQKNYYPSLITSNIKVLAFTVSGKEGTEECVE